MGTQHRQNCARHTPLAMKIVLEHQLKHGLNGLFSIEAPGAYSRSAEAITVNVAKEHLDAWLASVAVDRQVSEPTELVAVLLRVEADVRLPDTGLRVHLRSHRLLDGQGVDDLARSVVGMTDLEVAGR